VYTDGFPSTTSFSIDNLESEWRLVYRKFSIERSRSAPNGGDAPQMREFRPERALAAGGKSRADGGGVTDFFVLHLALCVPSQASAC
jgi:hypothetical protein